MVTVQALALAPGEGGCPEGPARALDTAQLVILLFGKWQV